MPQVTVRILDGKRTHADVVIDIRDDYVPNAATDEDAAMRFADWARKKSSAVRVIRRGCHVLVEVQRVEPT